MCVYSQTLVLVRGLKGEGIETEAGEMTVVR